MSANFSQTQCNGSTIDVFLFHDKHRLCGKVWPTSTVLHWRPKLTLYTDKRDPISANTTDHIRERLYQNLTSEEVLVRTLYR